MNKGYTISDNYSALIHNLNKYMSEKSEFPIPRNNKEKSTQETGNTTSTIESSDSEKEKLSADYDLIGKKLEICKFANPENFSFTNNYQMANNLYTAIFFPQQTQEIYDMITSKDKFPDGLQILSQPLSSIPNEIPTREEFIEKIRHVIKSEVDYASCINDDAEKFLENLMQKGKVNAIFTNGDQAGVEKYGLPGTKQQLHKIGSLKFPNTLRREIAQKENRDHKSVLSVYANEDKMGLFPEIIKRFAEKGVRFAVYIDDRLTNLIKAQTILGTQTGEITTLFPVWIRQGKHKDSLPKNQDSKIDYAKEFHAAYSLMEIDDVLNSNPALEQAIANNKVGFIVDLDEVIIDGNKQKIAELEAIILALQKKQWV